MMIKRATYIFILFLVLPFLGRCSKAANESHIDTFIPGESGIVSELGRAYESNFGSFYPYSCLQGGVEVTEQNLDGDIVFVKNTQFSETLDLLSGSLSLKFPVYPGVQAGGKVEFAISNSSSEVTDNIVYMVKLSQVKSIFNEQKSEYFKNEIEGNLAALNPKEKKSYLRRMCGDEYVKSITEGGVLFLSININYGSVENKEKYKAAFILSLAGGIGEATAGASIRLDKFAENINISIAVSQTGGSPENLVRLFPDGFPKCNYVHTEDARNQLKWADACNEVLIKLQQYATNPGNLNIEGTDIPSFLKQMAEEEDAFVALGYETETYNVNDLKKYKSYLAQPSELSREDKNQINENIFTIVNRSMAYANHRRKLINFLEYPIDRNQHETLFKLVKKEITKSYQANDQLNETLEECWKDRRLCLDENKVKMAIDKVLLDFPIDSDIFDYNKTINSYADWCRMLGPWENSLGTNVVLSDQFPNNVLLPREAKNLTQLYNWLNFSPTIIQNGVFDQQEFFYRCNIFQAELHRITGNALIFAELDLSIDSLRIFDYNSDIETIDVSHMKLNDFPIFYGLPSLKYLDISYNSFSYDLVHYGRIGMLPNSLQCINVSDSGHANDIFFSNYFLQQLKFPKVIMLGFDLVSSVDEKTKEIYVNKLNIQEPLWIDFINQRVNPLTIYIKPSFTGKYLTPPGNYGRIKVEINDQLDIKCN